jgi:hypothetical protein
MKKILFLLPFLLLSLSGYSQQLEWIPFEWVKHDQMGDKAVINIPVTIDDLPDKFGMQFDLGTDGTTFYGTAIDPYLGKNESLREKLDIKKSWFKNIHLHLGTVDFNGRDIFYYKNDGQAPEIREDNAVHIGTIGAEFFQDRVLVIDYKNTQIAIPDRLPAEYENLPYEKIELDGANRFIIPFRINGKEEWLLFSTSSGFMQLMTTRERALAISDSIVVDNASGNSDGYRATLIGSKVTKPVEFAGKVLENLTVYYEKDNYFDMFFTENDIVWGITGNACFWDNIVIIDYKNKTFRVK